ncbi:glycosyltransferase family 2 protein [Candidatus Woesebacteria bacterium]|nr:glycosyltransferase family 2 protein [Candidatus Woesebacteria bacterium]
MNKLSIVLAVRNEEENIRKCLESVKDIADEIVVVDEYSADNTAKIAKEFNANVYEESHRAIFHETKQIALSKSTGDWILQLDADEVVTPELAKEIKEVIDLNYTQVIKRKHISPEKWNLFQRHQKLVEERDGKIGKQTGEVVAFFVPRLNYFLGVPMKHSGIYPDGVIRLVRKGKARFPAKSVHEQIRVDGEVSWLENDLMHNDSPTFKKYLTRLNRYTDLHSNELLISKAPRNIFYMFYYSVIKAKLTFINIFIKHAGFKDGDRGFIWSFFSAMHFPIAYFKYWTKK